jgi:hypothetical protein
MWRPRKRAPLYAAMTAMGQAMAAMTVAVYDGTDDARKASLSAMLDAWDDLRLATRYAKR